MAEMKITKRDRFEDLKVIAAAAGRDDLVEFLDAQIEVLNTRAKKAREYKAKKSAAGDALRDKIEGVLKNEFITADEITELVAEGNEDITKAKVVARLTALCKANKAIRETAKIEGKRLKVYALPGTEFPAEE